MKMATELSTVTDFDDNDETEMQSSEANAGALVAPNHWRTIGIILSLLHQECSSYEKDQKRRDKLFRLVCQQLYQLKYKNATDKRKEMCFVDKTQGSGQTAAVRKYQESKETLLSEQVLPSQNVIDTFHPVQVEYLTSLRKMMHANIRHIQQAEMETRLCSLPATDHERAMVLLQLQTPLPRVPKIMPEEFYYSHTTRYQRDFIELGTLGKGGFGKVYKVRSKIDKCLYAVKKIKLKQADIDKSNKLVNEVRLLASLKHASVVGYNTAWIETESVSGTCTNPGGSVPRHKCLPPSSSESAKSSSEQESSTTDKNRVKIEDIGNTGEVSPVICSSDRNVSPLGQWQPVVGSPSGLGRSPSDSTSTLVNSPTEAQTGHNLDAVCNNQCNSDFLDRNLNHTNTVVTSSESFHQASTSVTSLTAEESIHCHNSISQSVTTKQDFFQSDLDIEFNSFGSEHEWQFDSDIIFNNQGSVNEDVDEEYSDIHINSSVTDTQSTGVLKHSTVPNDAFDDASSKSCQEFSSSVSGTFDSAFMPPSTASSQCEIIDLNESPNSQTDGESKKRERRRHRSRSEDGIIDKREAGTKPLHLATAAQPFPAFTIVLYIQMQLCSETLSNWLKRRNTRVSEAKDSFDVVDISQNMHMFRQLLEGMHYIHEQGFIHRDIKPKNIFLEVCGGSHNVLIGDFGLAKEDFLVEQEEMASEMQRSNIDGHAAHTAAVGTTTYAAPEQLKGRNYDCKSDMYSSGIILFEMFHPFSTDMERSIVITKLRAEGCIPSEIQNRWPVQSKTISELTHAKSCHRPNAAEVLKGSLFQSKDEIIKELRAEVSEKDAEIERLKKKLAEYEI